MNLLLSNKKSSYDSTPVAYYVAHFFLIAKL